MSFDERMRKRTKSEDCPLPAGFEGRLTAQLDALPAKKAVRRHPLRRGLLLAGAAVVLCLGGVMAAPTVLEMAQGTIDYFEVPAEFRALSSTAEYERFNSEVGASVTDAGFTVTVEHIAIDDTFLTLFYTITGEEPLLGINDTQHRTPEQALEFNLLGLRVKADGNYLENWGRQYEIQMVDDYTARIMERKPIMAVLPDVVNLELYSDSLFFHTPGTWHFALTVDKRAPAAESLVVEPNFTFRQSGHKVTVKKVSFSPLGGGMVLHEASQNGPYGNFVLRDDAGKLLPQRQHGRVSGWYGISNFVEIYGGRTDMESLTIVPYEKANPEGPDVHQVIGSLSDLPLTDDSQSGYTMLSLDVGRTVTTAVLSERGITPYLGWTQPDFGLMTAEGAYAELGECYSSKSLDRVTGLWTVTLTYPDATESQLAAVAQVALLQPEPQVLLEEEAIIIPLTSN